jgi:hypothetical protein
MQQQQIHFTKITTVQNEHLFTTTVSFVRAACVITMGRMRPAGRLFDMPDLWHADINFLLLMEQTDCHD